MSQTYKPNGYTSVAPYLIVNGAAGKIAFLELSVQAPVQKGDEEKRSGVTDAGGTTWWIATRVG